MLHDAGVAIVPGLDFGTFEPRQHVRISYATALPAIEEAMSRLSRLFSR